MAVQGASQARASRRGRADERGERLPRSPVSSGPRSCSASSAAASGCPPRPSSSAPTGSASRAMQDLVAEGMIYRVPGRGTFPAPRDGRYLRQFGSVKDLMGLSLDTQLELVVPAPDPGRHRCGRAAPPAVRRRHARELPAPARGCPALLHDRAPAAPGGMPAHRRPRSGGPGATSSVTVLGLLDERLGQPVVEAEQSITVGPVPPGCRGLARLPRRRATAAYRPRLLRRTRRAAGARDQLVPPGALLLRGPAPQELPVTSKLDPLPSTEATWHR